MPANCAEPIALLRMGGTNELGLCVALSAHWFAGARGHGGVGYMWQRGEGRGAEQWHERDCRSNEQHLSCAGDPVFHKELDS